jgi:hypothetical protein
MSLLTFASHLLALERHTNVSKYFYLPEKGVVRHFKIVNTAHSNDHWSDLHGAALIRGQFHESMSK